MASALAWLLAGCASPGPASASRTETDRQIRYYQKVLDRHPERYPVRYQLGEACLAKARESQDPVWLAKARQHIRKSLDVQPTYAGYLVMARVQNYSHRFADALDWAKRAASSSPSPAGDSAAVAAMVEACLGLGLIEEAGRLLPRAQTSPDDFHTATARAQWHRAQGQLDLAAADLTNAADRARQTGATSLEAWAEVSIAGCFIDHGRPEEARPHLEKAEHLDPASRLLRLHWGEYYEAKKSPDQALSAYQDLLGLAPDPAVHHRAYLAARSLGLTNVARGHFQAAEQGYSIPIEAGEIYTLGALAQLYAEAGVRLHRALDLARRNLEFKQDAEARATFQALEARQKTDNPDGKAP